MADRIKLLPDVVANQIAAGEVVNRPSSVVKEMMENAIDAGAHTVTVNARDGGRELIQIVDDGCGMSPMDARMAFDRHATSKIASVEDIYALHTFGFRGEALASIAAVAQVELRTRQEGDEVGTQTSVNGGKFQSQEPDILTKSQLNVEQKQRIARLILESLPDWFGIPEAREEYIEKSVKQPFFAAFDGENAVGFLYLAETGKNTAELYVMGVLKEYHRRGVGKMLFAAAKQRAKELGYSFLQVKTVQMGKYPEYDATNRFYLALGFGEFEVFPTLWDEWNPCQIYVMSLK